MPRRRARKTLIAAIAALGTTALISAVPASAACVAAEAWYQRPNQTKQYVYGPKQCVGPSLPLNPGLEVGVAPGEPSILVVGAKVWGVTP
jgi:hypothetical protein